MLVGELLYRISEQGVNLRCDRTEDRLHYSHKGALEPELLDGLRAHKQEIIQILREDEKMRRTGIVQSERQVFDLAREHFGLNQEGGYRMKRERRHPIRAEWAATTSSRLVVRRILKRKPESSRPENRHRPGPRVKDD
jgi:hypothetical protein